MTSSLPFVSVIVPVLNREHTIGECLRSLRELDYAPFEIVVIDGGSTDRTREITSRYSVTLISQMGGGGGFSDGIERARGEIVAFTHSDCVVQKDWLTNLVACYSNRVGGVGGQTLSQDSDSVVGKFHSLLAQDTYHPSVRVELPPHNTRLFHTVGLSSSNMSFRCSILREVGGFAEDAVKHWGHYISWKGQNAGHVLVYEPKAVVYHKPRSTVKELVKLFFRKGMEQVKLLKKQPGGYSYLEVNTYLFPAWGIRCKLPIRTLVTFDLFNIATLALVLAALYRPLIYLFGISFIMISPLVFSRVKEAYSKFGSAKLLLVFPFLHIIRSLSLVAGRVVGGVQSGILAF